jgi:hypothetical protein
MESVNRTVLSFCLALALTISAAFWSAILPQAQNMGAEARVRRTKTTPHTVSRHAAAGSGLAHGKRRHERHGSSRATAGEQASHHGRHHGRTAGSRHHKHAARKAEVVVAKKKAKPKYAYALDFFMWKAPDFDRSPLDESLAGKVKEAFARGVADDLPAEKLVRAGVFSYYPLSGGIFKRREAIKYIVLHSTETGIPVGARNVINGWNSLGRRHAGTHFVVERDGTILMALDPELASVHVNVFKTLPGINNDNTLGIEMNHTGRQDYPAAQRQATMRLVTYLQHRYNVTSENVISHRYAQQGDHTDPVNFDLDVFLAAKENFATRAIAFKRTSSPVPFDEETEDDAPLASVYVQIHGPISESVVSSLNTSKTPPAESKTVSSPTAGPSRSSVAPGRAVATPCQTTL